MATNPFNRGMNVAADLVPVRRITAQICRNMVEASGFAPLVPPAPSIFATTPASRGRLPWPREPILVGVTRIYAAGITATGIEVLI